MKELFERLADFRINEIVMPVFGSGHGGLSPKLAFVGLMLALAEAAKYGQGGQRLKRVVIVVFKKDAASVAQIEDRFVRRVLGLIAGGS